MCERFRVASNVATCIVREQEKRGWTDAELARRLKVTRSQVHDWVHGHHEPNLSSLRRIAKVFRCEVADLLRAA